MAEPKTELDHFRAVLEERDLRYQQRFDAQSQAIKDAFAASKEAITKAEAATEKRFEGVNEFRATLSDQASRFINRREMEAWRDQSREQIADLAERIQRIEGKSIGLNTGWGYIVASIAAIAAIAGIIMALFRS